MGWNYSRISARGNKNLRFPSRIDSPALGNQVHFDTGEVAQPTYPGIRVQPLFGRAAASARQRLFHRFAHHAALVAGARSLDADLHRLHAHVHLLLHRRVANRGGDLPHGLLAGKMSPNAPP